ncbi:TetR/AcrR family transcriptional regulator [Flagellimonas sp.]|jgi:TetR/AcrR family transcriptional repressor of nem operon|uniref:TetR/AcrR family transcriptional regulator n=1 Tax=Flagellimonas sp. TaxID=2058762 RepID=UPI003BAB9104
MPRTKQYKEQEVVEKAMQLFWRNGYETTSMHMLEKQMRINKFSIYASFGSKDGVFLESIKCYEQQLNRLIDKLEKSSNGADGIKEYFRDFLEFSKDNGRGKGCLITNTANEIGQDADEKIKKVLTDFLKRVRTVFAQLLEQDRTKNLELIAAQADYLIISMFGLSSASRVFGPDQMENYIENIFSNL